MRVVLHHPRTGEPLSLYEVNQAGIDNVAIVRLGENRAALADTYAVPNLWPSAAFHALFMRREDWFRRWARRIFQVAGILDAGQIVNYVPAAHPNAPASPRFATQTFISREAWLSRFYG